MNDLQRFYELVFSTLGDSFIVKERIIIDGIIVDDSDTVSKEALLKSNILSEHEIYKRIPDTTYYYRKDKGQPLPGKEMHIHVYKDSKHNNQLFAINADGTPHDGSKIIIGPVIAKYLRTIGIDIPGTGAILEWFTHDFSDILQD